MPTSSPLARLHAKSCAETEADERRREPRVPTRYSARLKSSGGAMEAAVLADVSLHGCCVSTAAGWLRQGSFVSIGLGEDLPMLAAIVRWVREGAAGMEFLRPVPSERIEWHDLIDMPLA